LCCIKSACLSLLLIGTKRIVGRVTASQMASASAASFFPRSTSGFNALREIDGLANVGANLVDRRFAVLVPWRLRPGKPGGSAFGVIAGALDLVDEILHVGGKAAGQEYADVKPLCRGMLFGLVEPGLEVLQGLDALSNYWVIHASSPLWCDIPSKAVCFMIVDDADRLHPGVDDDGSHELETALPHGI
jgi:hypothetical protein